MSIFYRPNDGVAADVIPFYWDGAFHLFYLKDYRDTAGHGDGTPWFHLVTRDGMHFTECGEALPRGPEGAQDRWVFTGSVLEKDGLFHIFYTGHNFHFTEAPMEAIMHATSPDLLTWEKDTAFRLFAPAGYEPNDWRDPFVYWDADAGEYHMLLAARNTTGPTRNRGCLALASSPDLAQWTVREPLWAPDAYVTHECPDLFRIGDWWYLIYSTFSERCVTHYRMSRSPRGPWIAPANDTFDGRAFYAAKTASDGTRRYAFGWLPTRAEDKDEGRWQWGGNLVIHALDQQPDGMLTVQAPAAVLAAYSCPVAGTPVPVLGPWQVTAGAIASASWGRFSACTWGALPQTCLVETTVTIAEGTANCGLLLRADEALDRYYQVRLEPPAQRMVIDRWPRPGDQPFMLERPLAMPAGQPVTLRLLLDGTNLVVYANDRVALSCRLYDHRQGNLGVFVTEGEARFAGLTVKTPVCAPDMVSE